MLSTHLTNLTSGRLTMKIQLTIAEIKAGLNHCVKTQALITKLFPQLPATPTLQDFDGVLANMLSQPDCTGLYGLNEELIAVEVQIPEKDVLKGFAMMDVVMDVLSKPSVIFLVNAFTSLVMSLKAMAKDCCTEIEDGIKAILATDTDKEPK